MNAHRMLIIIASAALFFGCNGTPQKAVHQQIKQAAVIDPKWYGSYTVDINEKNNDWRDMQKIGLKISKDTVFYFAEGYQIDQNYLLSATESNQQLKLRYISAMDNTQSAVLDKTKDFGTLTNEGETLKWTCPYIDASFGNGKQTTYTLRKSK